MKQHMRSRGMLTLSPTSSPEPGTLPWRRAPAWISAVRRSFRVAVLVMLSLHGVASGDDQLVRYQIVDGSIPEPLTTQPGDPVRGRRIVLDRDGGDCTICHATPLPQREFHGTIGPPLDGIGRRATPGALRLRLVDPKAFNPETIMPAYYKVVGLHRVLERYRAKEPPLRNIALSAKKP